ncbi:MAG: glycosyltransferase family 4 protein [Caulobacterales bacterium]
MAARLSILHPRGELGLGQNPFGKDVANLELFRAMAQHGGFEQLDLLTVLPVSEAHARQALIGDSGSPTQVLVGSALNQTTPKAAGALLRGQADLQNMAWLRRVTVGDRAYSLIGLVHTLAPPAIRQPIAMALAAPVHPWDAIVCTSPSVRDAVTSMFDAWGDFLGERTGGGQPPRPALPIVPLGVDGPGLAAYADRPQARAKVRVQLGLGEDDVLVLWVGRLSFFEKAYPQAMFQAVQRAARASGVTLHFALAGWFPGEADRGRYEEAAKAHAPDVPVHFLDGNDRTLLGELWAGADIFISLVDNIQETFGITPLEAMAAGLPVVVSDWDGYRSTVRDGIEGFLIPTLGGPTSGLGTNIVTRHLFQVISYQSYVGEVAQYTAVHVGRAADALTELARSPELRRRMGAAGRERIRTAFDWPVVARQVHELTDELAEIRRASPDPVIRQPADPVRGDPFVAFAGFPTEILTLETRLAAAPGATGEAVRGLTAVLDLAFGNLRATLEECAQALDLLATGRASSVREVLIAFPVDRRRVVQMGLSWMAKLGLVDWLA